MVAKKQKQDFTGKQEHASSENPLLAELLKAKGFTASAPTEPTAPSSKPSSTATTFDLSKMGKIVLRRERKGRGGKTVTLVSGITLPADKLEQLARALRKGLGCGSTVEQGTIVLQGDIALRAQEWLRDHGATKTVIG